MKAGAIGAGTGGMAKVVLSGFIRFYLVGLILFMLPFTRPLFILLIPYSLLLVAGSLFYFHRRWNVATFLFFLFIMASTFLLEMAGTSTGLIFGSYHYEHGLGIQVCHTPLIIGLNWLFLVYATRSMAEQSFRWPIIRIIVASGWMVLYDVLLEWVAPAMQMWRFDTGYPPVRNFIAWLAVSLIFHTAYEYLPISSPIPQAGKVLKIQMIFFLCIGLYTFLFIR